MSTTEQEVGDMDAENGEQTGGHVEQQQVEQPQAGESTQTTTTARGRPKKHRNIPVSSAQKDVGLVAYSATSAHCGATKHALASQMRHGKDGSYRRKRSEWHSGRANHV